jgi:hypothetical protein
MQNANPSEVVVIVTADDLFDASQQIHESDLSWRAADGTTVILRLNTEEN